MQEMTREQKREQAERLRNAAVSCRRQAEGELARLPTITGHAVDIRKGECQANADRLDAAADAYDAEAAKLERETGGREIPGPPRGGGFPGGPLPS